ncbi:hypothetical protein D3C86_1874330 [compost metagenome]
MQAAPVGVRTEVQGVGHDEEFALVQHLVFRVTVGVRHNGHAVQHADFTGQQEFVTSDRVHRGVELLVADDVLHQVRRDQHVGGLQAPTVHVGHDLSQRVGGQLTRDDLQVVVEADDLVHQVVHQSVF